MPRIISNSEVTAYNECSRRHWYQYQQELQPRSYGIALTRGIVGHQVLEQYYKVIQEGFSVDDAKYFALGYLERLLTAHAEKAPFDYDKLTMLSQLHALIDAYIEFYRVEEFRVISVEKTYIAPVDPSFSYGMKLDLLVEMIKGIYRGEIIVLDHKFIYNFKSDEELTIDGQLPKYIRTVAEAEGILITRGIFNQIRYRELKNPNPEMIFRRSWIKPSKKAKDRIWTEQIDASDEIVNNPRPPRRTLSPLVCKNCYFLQICRADLNDADTETMRKVDYMPLVDRYMDWAGD